MSELNGLKVTDTPPAVRKRRPWPRAPLLSTPPTRLRSPLRRRQRSPRGAFPTDPRIVSGRFPSHPLCWIPIVRPLRFWLWLRWEKHWESLGTCGALTSDVSASAHVHFASGPICRSIPVKSRHNHFGEKKQNGVVNFPLYPSFGVFYCKNKSTVSMANAHIRIAALEYPWAPKTGLKFFQYVRLSGNEDRCPRIRSHRLA